ncbi:DUF4082 domain-containing protein [Bradyrhizobium sp. CW11]|uniref:DUF4082 domain-containing protein n=1 Tax=Bradyrhizobium sp. CW11 TaxID=2782684 RepID=UPI001FFB3797|nr:DUF4082 domain-containing protein [Bradyrhizobium sp. CW11]
MLKQRPSVFYRGPLPLEEGDFGQTNPILGRLPIWDASFRSNLPAWWLALCAELLASSSELQADATAGANWGLGVSSLQLRRGFSGAPGLAVGEFQIPLSSARSFVTPPGQRDPVCTRTDAQMWSFGVSFGSTNGTIGWQRVNFATPVTITAGPTYIASYHHAAGNYSADPKLFASPVTNGPLMAPLVRVQWGQRRLRVRDRQPAADQHIQFDQLHGRRPFQAQLAAQES